MDPPTNVCCRHLTGSLVATQARARLRELHADILARQLAAAEAGTDVRAEMGWDREEREVQCLKNTPYTENCKIPCCTVRCAAGRPADVGAARRGCCCLTARQRAKSTTGHVQDQEAAAASPAAEAAPAANGQAAAEPEPEPEEDEDAALERLARPPDDAGNAWML